MPRYQVSGLPPAAVRGTSAFFPNFNLMAASGAQKYKGEVSGYPGTLRIPTQAWVNGTPPSPDLGDMVQMGLSRGTDSPEAFWPNLYYVTPEPNYRPGLLVQMYDPVSPELTTMIPMPAVSPRQALLRNAATMSMGLTGTGTDPKGRQQVRQPISGLVAWANRRRGNGLPRG